MAMNDDQKMAFVHKMTKTALEHIQHFDSGGQVQALGTPAPALSGPTSGVTSGGAPNPNTGLLGTIGGALGLNNNYQAGAANIQQGTNTGQLQNAYEGAQSAIGQQQGLVGQLQPGVAQGLGAQQALSGQLGQQALGLGPNPAQAALNQETGRNVANQAALMAGQRGAAGNVGLIAKQAAQQGAGLQQQAVGQGATLQAQQQLAAQQAQGNLAAQQIAQGASGIQGLSNAQQNEQNILQGANTSANNAAVTQQGNINQVNAGTARGNQGIAGQVLGGLASGASAALGVLGLAKGGVVPKMEDHHDAIMHIYHPQYMADGGLMVQPQAPIIGAQPGGWLNGGASVASPIQMSTIDMNPQMGQGFSDQFGDVGEKLGNINWKGDGQGAGSGAAGGAGLDVSSARPAMQAFGKGGAVKAQAKEQRAEVNGDSLKNDKVPAMLSPGELVIDRETMSDPGQMGQMARALAMHIQRRNKGGKK